MSGGFANPIAGGGGDLVYPAIQSPNFVHGVSGWKIAKDGSAEFQDIIIPIGSGGAVVTFAGSPPPSPHVGDLWYDTSNGLLLHYWTGSVWQPEQFSSAALSPTAGITSGQVGFTARNIGGITTTIAGSAPGSAQNGDLWFDSSNGYKLNQFESGSWTPYQFGTNSISAGSITAALIAANTITAAQLAAGIIYAGIVNGTLIEGATLVADGTTGQILVYEGTAAAGNLIGAWSGTAGSDSNSNAFIAGLQIGLATGNQLLLEPNVNSVFNITTAIAGTLEAMLTASTTDSNEKLPGFLGSVLLGTGTATKMSTLLSSPLAATPATASAIVLESENDAGSDTSVITMGTISTPDNSTLVFTPICAFSPFAFLLYSAVSGQTVVTKTSGSGTIAIPAGVTTCKAECWGAASGGDSANDSAGAGGEYAAEAALAVTHAAGVPYVVGAGSTGQAAGGTATIAAGGNSTLTGTSVTVTAHGGSGFAGGYAGGTGSSNTVHFDGGSGGGPTIDNGGCGGGSSAGTGSAGNVGQTSDGNTGVPGGVAPTGGAAGGKGGNGTNSSSGAQAGSDGSAPGGGAGMGGFNGGAAGNNWAKSGNGAAGQVRVTYSTGAPTILFSVALSSGTDQFGTSYPAGIKLGTNLLTELAGDLILDNISAPSTPTAGPALFGSSGHLDYVSTDANVYDTGRLTLVSTANPYNVTSTTPGTITGLSCPVVAGTYKVRCVLICTQGGAAFGTGTQLAGPSTSLCTGTTRSTEEATSETVNVKVHSSLPSNFTGPAYTASANFVVEIDMLITFSASGTLLCQAYQGTSTHQWKVLQGSTMTVEPVVA